jgi:hypothetical protein
MTHEARRHVLAWDGAAQLELWRRGRFHDTSLGTFTSDLPGQVAALAAFSKLESNGVALGGQQPRTFQPRTIHALPIATALTLIATVVTVSMYAGSRTKPSDTSPGNSDLGATAATNPGWVYRDSTQASYLQWTQTGDTITGSLTTTYLPPEATETQTENRALTGAIQGDSITLSLPSGGGTNLAVQKSGANLVVSWPDTDGTLQPLKFVTGTSGDYNAAVAALHQRLTSNLQASASAAADAFAQGAVNSAATHQVQAYKDLTSAVTALQTDLASPGPASQELAAEAADLKVTQNAAAKVKSEAAKAQPGDPEVCINASGVQIDAGSVLIDQNSVTIELNSLDQDATAVTRAVADMSAAQTKLTNSTLAAPDYQPSITPSSTFKIQAAKSAASTAVAAAATTKQNTKANAQSLYNQAKAAADSATKAAGC